MGKEGKDKLEAVNIEEAAEILGIGLEQTRKLLRKGTILGYKVGKGRTARWRVRISNIAAFINKRESEMYAEIQRRNEAQQEIKL